MNFMSHVFLRRNLIILFHIMVIFVLGLSETWAQRIEKPDPLKITISTVITPENIRMLAVKYPFNLFKKMSVEIRLLENNPEENIPKMSPVYFLSRVYPYSDLKPEPFKTVVYKMLQDEEDSVHEKREYNALDMDFYAWVDPLQIRQLGVMVEGRNTRTSRIEHTFIFPMPERSVLKDGIFCLDLRHVELKKSQKLLIWVLQDEKIIHKEIFNWPGRYKYEESPNISSN